MKTSRTTGNSAANSSMIQPLESRRLMSLTSGIDLPAASPPPTASQIVQINHAIAAAANPQAVVQQFMATQSVPALPVQDAAVQDVAVANFPPAPPVGPDTGDNDALESQLAQAIAHGTPLIVFPTAVADAQRSAAEETRPTTLSALYSTIGTSTVSAIDNAATAASNSRGNVPVELAEDLALSQTITDPGKAPTLPNIETTNPANAQNNAAGILLSSLATSPPGNSSTTFEVSLMDRRQSAGNPPQWPGEMSAAQPGSALSRNILLSLEQELLAVKAYSQELVWSMGRDRAIELSHARTVQDISQEKSSDWKTTAAVIGAAIAGIVYAEKELVRGKKNVGSIFSVRPLRDDPGIRDYAG